MAYVNNYLRLKGLLGKDDKVRERDVLPIIRWWNEEYKDGRNTAISQTEMKEKIGKHLPQYLKTKNLTVQK